MIRNEFISIWYEFILSQCMYFTKSVLEQLRITLDKKFFWGLIVIKRCEFLKLFLHLNSEVWDAIWVWIHSNVEGIHTSFAHIQMSKGQVFKIKKLKQQQQSNDVFFLRGNYFILISVTLPTLSTFYVQQWSVALSQCLLMHIWFDFDYKSYSISIKEKILLQF